MSDSGIIIILAYPDTVVTVPDEWYAPFLRFFGIGNKYCLRAGHAALVLINKETSELAYHDFGRYITPKPTGRVRGKETDNELDFPLKAKINNNKISNLDEILIFLATNPKLTHGEGKLIASVCNAIHYRKAKAHIKKMQEKQFIRYAAFIKNASNCARFVTNSLIAAMTDAEIKKKLMHSNWFTPSTVGNVVIADTEDYIYEVSETGMISEFKGSVQSENRRCFLDRMKHIRPNLVGTLKPMANKMISSHAQWLSGIAAGAWFELCKTDEDEVYRFKRISPHGNIDCDALFKVEDATFDYKLPYKFLHASNCKFLNIEQNSKWFRFDRL